jgi:hypothetical protein
MTYTLISSKGKIYTFFIKAVADTYQQAYGGVVLTQQILEENYVEKYERVATLP